MNMTSITFAVEKRLFTAQGNEYFRTASNFYVVWSHRAAKGFTLIELLIAIAIVGLLATIALPSYQAAMAKSRRADAQSFLIAVAQQQQQYFVDNRSYTSCLVVSGTCTSALNLPVPAMVAKYYSVSTSVSSGLPPGFTVTATPLATSAQAGDPVLTLNQAGVKTPAGKW